VGVKKEPPVLFEANIANINKRMHVGSDGSGLPITFHSDLAIGVEVHWDATLYPGGYLLVDMPSTIMSEGSKESFVNLLEFAEEKLHCTMVLVAFPKASQDRAALIRAFMYFGFAMLAPNRSPLPANVVNTDQLVLMAYQIN
jgi:hypothetical protein